MQRAEHPCVKARAGDPSANPIAPQEFWAPGREEDFISFLLFARPREDYSMKFTTPMQSHTNLLLKWHIFLDESTLLAKKQQQHSAM